MQCIKQRMPRILRPFKPQKHDTDHTDATDSTDDGNCRGFLTRVDYVVPLNRFALSVRSVESV